MIDAVTSADADSLDRAKVIASKLNLPLISQINAQNLLIISTKQIVLSIPELGKPFSIDFGSGKYDHRRQFGGGRGQAIAKAIGLKQGKNPSVVDATAGFARDAFVIASLGSRVQMIEKNPVMATLIEDALERGRVDDNIHDITERMSIVHANACDYLAALENKPDVVYLDPMYPSRDKSALVKKEMRLLHQLVGTDDNSSDLLNTARQTALNRVVVKRPKTAEFLADQKPSTSIASKNTRFDIYLS